MRLEPVPFSMLVIGVAFACHSPSPSSLRERAHHSAVVIEGRVQSAPHNASGAEPYRVDVKVLDVWPRHSGGLEREQLVTVRELGPTSGPCARVLNDHRYIFFMDPTDEPLVFRASYAPLEASGKDLKKDVGKILCEDCGKFGSSQPINTRLVYYKVSVSSLSMCLAWVWSCFAKISLRWMPKYLCCIAGRLDIQCPYIYSHTLAHCKCTL